MLFVALCVIYGLSLGVFLVACFTAPEGYEDEQGFHLIRPRKRNRWKQRKKPLKALRAIFRWT